MNFELSREHYVRGQCSLRDVDGFTAKEIVARLKNIAVAEVL
ncbi:MAG: hypothetical protein Q7U84_05945 [Polynucleobacter sp.]|nr:hypothetical protein [Polynucleobacter sp.]